MMGYPLIIREIDFRNENRPGFDEIGQNRGKLKQAKTQIQLPLFQCLSFLSIVLPKGSFFKILVIFQNTGRARAAGPHGLPAEDSRDFTYPLSPQVKGGDPMEGGDPMRETH
jgi:hypothetical protein